MRILLLLSATCLTICAAINIIDDLDCYSDASNVVSCPCVPPPPKGVETRLCSCDHNALPLTSLERHCDSAGNHWGEPKCGCKPGYEFRDGVCEVCPPGTYKYSVSNVEGCIQAPYDNSSYCRTNPRFRGEHVFTPTTQLHLDSHHYQNLIQDSKPVWKREDFDGDSGQWTQRGGICQYDLRACSYRQGPQDNWIFTQYISYLDPLVRELFVQITFRFSQCTSNPACTNDFVIVHRYDTDTIDIDGQTNKTNYQTVLGILQQEGRTDNTIHWKFARPSTAKGFYIGFQDIGTCGQIKRILINHFGDPGYRNAEELVTCPTIPFPPQQSDDVTTKQCECDANSVPVTSLDRSCDSRGDCTGDPACRCKPGYELNADGTCKACPPGTFKATISNEEKCTPCPLNSISIDSASEVCDCKCNKVRPPNRPEEQCGSPPSPPRIANKNPPEIDADCTATICWLPVSDDGGNTGTLHYNVYTYASLHDRYIKINDDEIKGGNNGKDDVICYEFEVEIGDTSLSVVVTSASVATGDLEVIEDLADILGGSIFFQIMKQSSESTEEKTPEIATDEPSEEKTATVEVSEPVDETEDLIEDKTPTVSIVPEEPTEGGQQPYFKLRSTILSSDSTINYNDIGEGDFALKCVTQNTECCKRNGNLQGQFYYPDDVQVPVRAHMKPLYRNRAEGYIKLNRRGGRTPPVGRYRCEIPDEDGKLTKIFINIQ